MKAIRGSITIHKSISIVTNLFMNPDSREFYQDGYVKTEVVSGEQGQNGCVSTLYYKYGDRDMILTETVTNNQLPDTYEAFYHHEHMDNTMKCTFTEVDANTTRYDYEYDYTRINWIMPKLMSIIFPGMYRKQGQKWIDQFKVFVEAQDD